MQPPLDQDQNDLNTPQPAPQSTVPQQPTVQQPVTPLPSTPLYNPAETTEFPQVQSQELPTQAEVAPVATPIMEKQPVTEIYKAPEIYTQPETTAQPIQTDQTLAAEPPVPAPPETNIIDKTAEEVPLHHISTSTDKLTTIADQEEEKFIQQVEAAHDNN